MGILRLLFAAFVLLSVAACGGGEYEYRMMFTFDPEMSRQPGFDSAVTPPSHDAEESINGQLRGNGHLAFQIPGVKDGNFHKYLPHLQELMKHKNRFKWFYVFDEMFWDHQRGVTIGALESEITEAALTVRWHGFKSAVSILPDVILHPEFKVNNINAFDVIAVDVYPSNITSDFGCSSFPDNPSANLLACSYFKLRDMGFSGEVWYMYQAFGVTTDANLRANLEKQRQTILIAPSIGINGLVAYGLDMPVGYEEGLYGLAGTEFEPLVTCADWCSAIPGPGNDGLSKRCVQGQLARTRRNENEVIC